MELEQYVRELKSIIRANDKLHRQWEKSRWADLADRIKTGRRDECHENLNPEPM